MERNNSNNLFQSWRERMTKRTENKNGRTYAQCDASSMIQTNERNSTKFEATDAEKHSAQIMNFSRDLILAVYLEKSWHWRSLHDSWDIIDLNASARNIDWNTNSILKKHHWKRNPIHVRNTDHKQTKHCPWQTYLVVFLHSCMQRDSHLSHACLLF